MARTFLTPLNLSQNELQNARVQNLAAAPSNPAPVKGQMYFNSSDNTLYWYNGSSWVSAAGGGAGFPGYGAVAAEPTAGSASADGVATAVARADHKHGNPTHTGTDHNNIPLNALLAATSSYSMGNQKITNMADPGSPQDVANKRYVDGLVQGLDTKASVRLASTASFGAGGQPTGGGTVDGVTVVDLDRVLLKNQSNGVFNGIWIANLATNWTRATDADAWAELVSAYTFVEEGTTNADTGWTCTVDATGTLGTTAINWTQFSGAGNISAGTGLTQTGSTINVGAGLGVVVNADDVTLNWGGTGGSYGGSNTVARTDHDHSTIYPPINRTINTTAPLTGGGDLSSNRTLAINNFSGSAAGAVPVSVGGTTNYLRADGSWAAPPLDTTTGDTRWIKSFAQNVGGATSVAVAHNLATRDVQVEVYRVASPYDTVDCDVERTDTNTVTLRFTVAPAAAEFRCIVQGRP